MKALSKLCSSIQKHKVFNEIIIISVISLLYNLFFSNCTSPLSSCVSIKDSIGDLFAKGVLFDGKVPYVDIIDTSGVMKLWVYMLINSIGGRIFGRFIVQYFLTFIASFFIYKTANLFLNRKNSYVIIFVGYILLLSTNLAGIVVELISFPLIAIGLYSLLRNSFNNRKANHLSLFLYGVIIGFLVFVELSHAIYFIGILLTFEMFSFSHHNNANIKKEILFFFQGFFIIFLVVISITSYLGYFQSMFYWTIVYPIESILNKGGVSSININEIIHKIKMLFPLFIYFGYRLFSKKKVLINNILFILSIFTILLYVSLFEFDSSIILFIPLYCLLLSKMLQSQSLERLLLVSVLFLFPFKYYTKVSYMSSLALDFSNPNRYEYIENSNKRAFSIIPIEDRKNRVLFEGPFELLPLMNSVNIFCQQKFISPNIDSLDYNDITLDLLERSEYKWFVLSGRFSDVRIRTYVINNFEEVFHIKNVEQDNFLPQDQLNYYLGYNYNNNLEVKIFKRNNK